MTPPPLRDVASYWDAVADRYLELFRHELAGKPFDRQVLDEFAARVGRGGRACDAGCGPCGHVTAHLAARALDVVGVDLAPRCVELARREHPHLRFEVMDMGALGFADGSLDGLVAYYATHYQPASVLRGVLGEFHRALRPGGHLLVVAKAGEGESWIEDPLGSGRRVFWFACTERELVAAVVAAGFLVERSARRPPLPDEIAAQRIYVTAVRSPG